MAAVGGGGPSPLLGSVVAGKGWKARLLFLLCWARVSWLGEATRVGVTGGVRSWESQREENFSVSGFR